MSSGGEVEEKKVEAATLDNEQSASLELDFKSQPGLKEWIDSLSRLSLASIVRGIARPTLRDGSLPKSLKDELHAHSLVTEASSASKRSEAAEAAMSFLEANKMISQAISYCQEAIHCNEVAFQLVAATRLENKTVQVAPCVEYEPFFRRMAQLLVRLALLYQSHGQPTKCLEYYSYAAATLLQKCDHGDVEVVTLLYDWRAAAEKNKRSKNKEARLLSQWIIAIQTGLVKACHAAYKTSNFVVAKQCAHRLLELLRHGRLDRSLTEHNVFSTLLPIVVKSPVEDSKRLVTTLEEYVRTRAQEEKKEEQAASLASMIATAWETVEEYSHAFHFWQQGVYIMSVNHPHHPTNGLALIRMAMCEWNMKAPRLAHRTLARTLSWHHSYASSDDTLFAKWVTQWQLVSRHLREESGKPHLILCYRMGCENGKNQTDFRVCSHCDQVVYCSIECQTFSFLFDHCKLCPIFKKHAT